MGAYRLSQAESLRLGRCVSGYPLFVSDEKQGSHMLLRMSRGLGTQKPPWNNLIHRGVLRRAQVLTPGQGMLLALSSLPPPRNTCKLGLALGPASHCATAPGACPVITMSGDFLHLRNVRKGLLHPAQPPQSTPTPGTAQPVWGPFHPTAHPCCL